MKKLLIFGFCCSVALFLLSLHSWITEGSGAFSAIFGALLTVLNGVGLRSEYKPKRPTPSPVSEGCGSNHRETRDDV